MENFQHCLHKNLFKGSQSARPAGEERADKKHQEFKYRAAVQTHPEDPVGGNDRRLVIDSCDIDEQRLWGTLLSQACVVGHHSELVSQGFTAVVDVVDKFMFHLDQIIKK